MTLLSTSPTAIHDFERLIAQNRQEKEQPASKHESTSIILHGVDVDDKCDRSLDDTSSSSSSSQTRSPFVAEESFPTQKTGAFHHNASTHDDDEEKKGVLPSRLTLPTFASSSPINADMRLLLNANGGGAMNSSIITTMSEFVHYLPIAIQQRKQYGIPPGAWNDPISQLFRQFRCNESVWQNYAHWNSDKAYTRNLISTDHRSYTLLLLCWNPDRYSPIHDHPCDGCWMKVLQGSVRECRYRHSSSGNDSDDTSAPSKLECIADDVFTENQLAYITDSMGYHKVGNPSESTPAVTLHLYSPPFSRCQTWASESSAPKLNHCASKYDTEFGNCAQTLSKRLGE
mmetsp:Transcript_19905/g.56333  ORF Transcript_19905/g.56333 Transcript_19905/m.56333 type:complete len:343 (+) Transcript_19905:279-1307(+)|eukprot:CAMPEP_0119560618 /NCGR_PEP_ID=MMETSP1352-20130426/15431_1 /TAXON_ID=265584 /ORGANISM="Stauroneis constricta, Strain CCMP1120" /LENGTH=342 /DNA_ID=CAMNT_0007608649 /DNA_START=238 /DNA_END=1266 /DNA_ORIENTATION=+